MNKGSIYAAAHDTLHFKLHYAIRFASIDNCQAETLGDTTPLTQFYFKLLD